MIVVPPVIAAGPPLASYSYSFAGGKPAGMTVEDASRSNMIPTVISGSRLQEQSTGGGGTSHWYSQWPGLMNSRKYRATVTVGNGSSGTNRGCIVWVGGTDGAGGDGITNLVWLRVRGQAGIAPVIGTKSGLLVAGTGTDRAIGSNASVTASDTISLEISESGGIYTYTGYKNGVALPGCVWTDSAAAFGVPGKAWGCGGQGVYSGGWFGSLGVYAMACDDLP